jgi:DNA adenine methylase
LNKYPTIESAVINDINEDLITTYNIIKNKPLELISFLKQIQYEFYKLAEFEKQKEYFLNKRQRFNTKGLDDIENSAIFIFLNRTCFNGLYRVNSKGLFNVPFGKYTNPLICDEQTLLEDSKLLQKVEILNGDFSQTLDYLNNKTLFYLDPPYRPLTITSSFTSYSSERFDDNEQKRLCEFCNLINNNKQKFILSNSDPKNTNANDNFFDELYSNFNINRIYAKRAINSKGSKRGDISELLIDNFNSNFGEFYNA